MPAALRAHVGGDMTATARLDCTQSPVPRTATPSRPEADT